MGLNFLINSLIKSKVQWKTKTYCVYFKNRQRFKSLQCSSFPVKKKGFLYWISKTFLKKKKNYNKFSGGKLSYKR